jgi:ABC-2 type transport system permease protein
MTTAAIAADITQPLSSHDETRLFWRLRMRMLANIWRQTLSQARLRFTLVLVLSVVFWVSLFLLFAEAFQFLLSGAIPLESYEDVISTVFGLFFVSLMVMLVFSTGIILYSSLYRSREAALLLTMPVRAEQVFVHKFQEAVLFSSWGFLLMGTPMLVAYGMTALAPWWYFAMLAPFMVAFVYVPSAVGAILCMLIVYRVPTARVQVLGGVALALVALAAWFGWHLFARQESDLLTPLWFQEMMGRLRFSQYRLLPSWWLSSGLLEAAQPLPDSYQHTFGRPPWAESVLFLALLISNALLMRQLAVWVASRVYRASYSRVHAQLPSRRQIGVAAIDRAVMRFAFFLSPTMRLLVVKDLRLFRRDPVQWSQFLIFFGLLSMYFINVRRFGANDADYRAWVNMVSFLNLAVVGLILSTFTTRFIFPMISLEGRRFWILSLLPARRETILWGKFLFAAIGSLATCVVLVVLSDVMLGVAPLVLLIHVLSCLILCIGLSAIAVGLGALLPNLREDSPSKIAAGFGGTLNLVLSTLYIIAIVALTAVPCHFYIARLWDLKWLVGGVAVALFLGLTATLLPMRAGIRAFRDLEF